MTLLLRAMQGPPGAGKQQRGLGMRSGGGGQQECRVMQEQGRRVVECEPGAAAGSSGGPCRVRRGRSGGLSM
jgi:hypothetical protein